MRLAPSTFTCWVDSHISFMMHTVAGTDADGDSIIIRIGDPALPTMEGDDLAIIGDTQPLQFFPSTRSVHRLSPPVYHLLPPRMLFLG